MPPIMPSLGRLIFLSDKRAIEVISEKGSYSYIAPGHIISRVIVTFNRIQIASNIATITVVATATVFSSTYSRIGGCGCIIDGLFHS